MKDSILNTVLIAVTFAAILFAATDLRPAAPAATAKAERVFTMEKTVVAARRLPVDVAAADADVAGAGSNVTLIASNER